LLFGDEYPDLFGIDDENNNATVTAEGVASYNVASGRPYRVPAWDGFRVCNLVEQLSSRARTGLCGDLWNGRALPANGRDVVAHPSTWIRTPIADPYRVAKIGGARLSRRRSGASGTDQTISPDMASSRWKRRVGGSDDAGQCARHSSPVDRLVQVLRASERARCRDPGRAAQLGNARTRLGATVALYGMRRAGR
jgi:hypothetical protein